MKGISLTGKKCLITGATGGLGRAIATQLARDGLDLFLTGRKSANLAELTREQQLTKPSGSIAYLAADLALDEDIDALIEGVAREFGTIDILINNAALFPVQSFEDCSADDYDQTFAVNVRAPFRLARAFIPAMARRGWGRIVNIGSSSAYAGFKRTSLYCASKHALLGLSRSLSDEFKAKGVRTYFLAPGSMKTEMGRLVPGQDFDTFIDPEELAEYLAFVISFDGNAVTDEIRMNRVVIQ